MDCHSEVQYIKSERGQPLVVVNGFKFRKDRETQRGVAWRCTVNGCKSRMYLNDTTTVILFCNEVSHNHDINSKLARQVVSNSVKRKAVTEVSERPLKLIRKEVAEMGVEITSKDVACIKQSIYRAKRSILPPLPKTLGDVHAALEKMTILSMRNENMLIINDDSLNVVCFSTETNLRELCQSNKIFVDGTFNYCSKFFHQLFIIHISRNGSYIPLVFSLLPGKSTETYYNMFSKLVTVCDDINIKLQPATIVADFEQSIHKAVKQVWPTSSIIGCRFHITQAWWRKIQSLGLSSEYKDINSEIGKWLHWVFGLTFICPHEVGDAFVEDLMSTIPANLAVTSFADYLTSNFIESDATFPPEIWASDTVTSERTTNACEAFHRAFGLNFNSAHPHIFTFVDAIINTQTSTYIKFNDKNTAPNPAYDKRRRYIEQLICEFKRGNISRLHFLKSVSYYYNKT